MLTPRKAVDCSTGMPNFDAAAWGTIKAYCGWHVAPSLSETLVVSVRHTSHDLYLPSRHVTDIQLVEVKGWDGSWHELPEARYDWDDLGLLRLRGGCWPRRLRSVRVTLTHGYDYDEVPHIVALADTIGRRARQNLGGVASQSVNGSSVSYQTAGGAPLSVPLLNIEKEMLDTYRVGVGLIRG